MNILGKIGIILGICLIGEAVSLVLPFPFPGSVLSMLILLILLLLGVVKVSQIEQPSQFFLSNMLFFFIPAGVGIIRYLDLIRDNLIAIVVICILSTILTFAATAYTIKLVLWLQRRSRKGIVR